MVKNITSLSFPVVLGALALLGSLVIDSRHGVVDTAGMLDPSVTIFTVSHVRIDQVGDSVWESGSGAGFLVSSDNCEIWTNHHVVADAALIEVWPRGWPDAAGIPATLVSSSARHDIAILRLERCDGIRQARLGRSDALRPGDEVYAVGNPLGHNPDSITRGIISHTERLGDDGTPFLQTDAAINPGNSGGALFNHEGEVIGITSAIASTHTGNNVGVGYAVPIDAVKDMMEVLRRGPPSWGDAGISNLITALTPDEARIFGVPDGHGALVLTHSPDRGPAVGKLFAHDAIFKLEAIGVADLGRALRFISRRKAGETITFELMRDGKRTSVPITLANGFEANEAHSAEWYEGHLGLTLEMWHGHEGKWGRIETPVITRVHSLGPAHRARIASSQRTLMRWGPSVLPIQLDVKTVTGVVLDGVHHRTTDVESLHRLAATAFTAGRPLLLEIELWARGDPRDPDAELKRVRTEYYKVMPALTTAAAPAEVPDPIGLASGETSPDEPPRPVDARDRGKSERSSREGA